MSEKEIQIIAEEFILNRIYLVRGKQVMLSHDLTELYWVETKALNQQVKRNTGKFPVRYMFQLSKKEYDRLRSHFVTFKEQHTKYLPYAFTEHEILMLSSFLRSERADKVNMMIIDTFVKLRELMCIHKDLANQMEKVQEKLLNMITRLWSFLNTSNRLKRSSRKSWKIRTARFSGQSLLLYGIIPAAELSWMRDIYRGSLHLFAQQRNSATR